MPPYSFTQSFNFVNNDTMVVVYTLLWILHLSELPLAAVAVMVTIRVTATQTSNSKTVTSN